MLARALIVKQRAQNCYRSFSSVADISASQLARFTQGATDAANAGAAEVFKRVDQPRTIEFKGTTDLVTDTDKASEVAIIQSIIEKFSDHAILGEEGGLSHGDASSEFLWVVDPLDGTTNFSHGYLPFAVSVGLLHRATDTPIAACVIEFTGGKHDWSTKQWSASKGGGCYCNGNRVNVSQTAEMHSSLLATGFGYNHDEAWGQNMDFFKHFTDESRGVRRAGAAAIDLCHVSLGILDGYWEYNLGPWDTAAGVLLVEEVEVATVVNHVVKTHMQRYITFSILQAGGVITTMDGKPYSVW